MNLAIMFQLNGLCCYQDIGASTITTVAATATVTSTTTSTTATCTTTSAGTDTAALLLQHFAHRTDFEGSKIVQLL
jgi:ABC-type sulfate transport system permease component